MQPGLTLFLPVLGRFKLPMSRDFLNIPTLFNAMSVVPVLILSLQTCAPCFKRAMMYAASPLVIFFSLSGSESTFEGSWKSCTDLLTYPHLLATNNFWAGDAGPCRHFAVRNSLQSKLSKDARQKKERILAPVKTAPSGHFRIRMYQTLAQHLRGCSRQESFCLSET